MLRRDIEGLRALAVGLVVLYHAHFLGLDGGFIGVDVFFVLSGYLICGQIYLALQQGDFSALDFVAIGGGVIRNGAVRGMLERLG